MWLASALANALLQCRRVRAALECCSRCTVSASQWARKRPPHGHLNRGSQMLHLISVIQQGSARAPHTPQQPLSPRFTHLHVTAREPTCRGPLCTPGHTPALAGLLRRLRASSLPARMQCLLQTSCLVAGRGMRATAERCVPPPLQQIPQQPVVMPAIAQRSRQTAARRVRAQAGGRVLSQQRQRWRQPKQRQCVVAATDDWKQHGNSEDDWAK